MDRKAFKKHSFWQDGDDFEWHANDDGWHRSYPFGYAKVVDLMDWGAEGYGVQVYGYDGKLWEMVGVTTPQAAMDMADEEAERFDLIGDGSIMSASKRAFVAGYMAAQKVAWNWKKHQKRITALEYDVWFDAYWGAGKWVDDPMEKQVFLFEAYNDGSWTVSRKDPISGLYQLGDGVANSLDDAKRCCEEWLDEHTDKMENLRIGCR